jgi:BirA family biotin operon repressor/biotin-[acetyl-CoA-carboxylase] ligase
LTCSFVLHPPVAPDRFGWIGLLAGLGAVNALRATAGVPATLKWPNDLLVPADTEIEGWGAARKVGGILAEVVALVAAQQEIVQRWRDSGGDAVGSGLAGEVAAVCSTLGTRVRVELPGGGAVSGLADRLDDDGALVVVDDLGTAHRVLAGDVRHVRAAP